MDSPSGVSKVVWLILLSTFKQFALDARAPWEGLRTGSATGLRCRLVPSHAVEEVALIS
jgi:hypothetical protein